MEHLGKILIVDDVLAIREIVKFYFESLGECEFLEADSGQSALAIFQRHPDIQLIFSDYFMHPGNGEFLAQEVRKASDIPFVLHTGDPMEGLKDLRKLKNTFFVPKPLQLESFTEVIRKALVSRFHEDPSTHKSFYPVSLSLIQALVETPVDLYVKLSAEKFVKQLHKDAFIDPSEVKSLTDKGVRHLYLQGQDFHVFSDRFKILSGIATETTPATTPNLELLSTSTSDLILAIQSKMGITPEIQQLTEKNIELVLKLAERDPGLKDLSEKFAKMEGTPYSQHCVLTALISTSIGKNLNWVSSQTSIKFAYAAMIHDAALSIEEWELELSLALLRGQTSPQWSSAFLNHPSASTDFVRKWPGCPPDVDVIVSQHHEAPDGSGFPSHLKANRINPLSALFIVAHHLALDLVVEHGTLDVPQWINKNETLYSHGDFKKVISHIFTDS